MQHIKNKTAKEKVALENTPGNWVAKAEYLKVIHEENNANLRACRSMGWLFNRTDLAARAILGAVVNGAKI